MHYKICYIYYINSNNYDDIGIIAVYKLSKNNSKRISLTQKPCPWVNFKNCNNIDVVNVVNVTQELIGKENIIKDVKTQKLKRNEGFYILSNKNHVSNYLKKTKFCNIMIKNGNCNRKKCDFAHSIADYNFPECVFKDNCKKKDECCIFKHPNETIEEFKERTNFNFPKNIF